MSNVIEGDFLVTERIVIPFERIFEGAKNDLDADKLMIVIGTDKEGFLRIASTRGSVADAVLLLEKAKSQLLR